MIGFLKGVVAYSSEQLILLDVGNVGYKVFVPYGIQRSVKDGETLKVYTYLYVRDDALELYGFSDKRDLHLFELLITVSGVGCKTALSVFNIARREDIVEAIVTGNVSFFMTVPRLGKKNAQKIIIELKHKLGSDQDVDLSGGGLKETRDVIDALKRFGFSFSEAQQAVKSLNGQGKTAEEKIRLALKYLGK